MAEIMPQTNEITDANETEVEEEIRAGTSTSAEDLAKEEERALADFLLPSGASLVSIKITDHAFIRSQQGKLYTVYKIESQRGKVSGDAASAQCTPWFVYRRYQQFRALNDTLRPKGYQVPILPPKKLIGSSCEPEFLTKRKLDLSNWLEQLVRQTQSSPHKILENEEVRRFLTLDADEIPAGLMKHHPDFQKSATKGDTFKGDGPKTTLKDFELIKVIGKGSFGKVMLVRKKDSRSLYAMKVLNKGNVVKRKQVEHTRTERRVLGRTKHPFIVTLHYAFQDPEKLYFVLDYCAGGELFFHLTRQKKLTEHMARFYTAEITLALDHLHTLGVVYRDLKPENILLDEQGHIKLADFGLAKEGIRETTEGTNSLCGTPEYLPPEILDRRGHGTAVDWWNLGMVLYEMLTGLPPWYTSDRKKLFDRLRSARLQFPPYVSGNAKSIIQGLLMRNPAHRLGGRNGAEDLKGHSFFESMNWEKLLERKVSPPFNPCQKGLSNYGLGNFESEFTKLPLESNEDGRNLDKEAKARRDKKRELASQAEFPDFTFEADDSPMQRAAKD